MVNIGHSIKRLGYRPAGGYALDLEVFCFSELRRRVGSEHLKRTYRYGFFFLFCVTQGRITTVVDFRTVTGSPGSLIIVKPQQTHRIVLDEDADGFVLMFKEDFLQPTAGAELLSELNLVGGLARVPGHLSLSPEDFSAALQSLQQMQSDARLAAPPARLNALLRHSVSSFLSRLELAYCPSTRHPGVPASTLERFGRFQTLLEDKFALWHDVESYARELGCSERSLTRATLETAGLSAKDFISARILLEAKRLLVQTGLPVGAIADLLGFTEATNFVKFFRKAEDCTPLEFRKGQAEREPAA